MFNKVQDDEGNVKFIADGGGSEEAEFVIEFADGVEAAVGRGETDEDRTYVRLKRSDGTDVYLYVDTGTTLTVSTTKP